MSEEKNNVESLNEIFEDDPLKEEREKEIAKYEKKRQRAIAREEKKAAKAAAQNKQDDAASDSAGTADMVDGEPDERALKKKARAERKAARKAAKAEKEINIVRDLILLCLYISLVVALCWVLLTFVGQRTEVSGESMSNTLHSGDTLWIDKLAYEIGDPERYDVVVFPYEDEADTYYIKRVIGLPGETVYIDEAGNIYINDELLDTDVYGREKIASDKRGVAEEPVTLGEDEYFVLGDNRNNSRDSRISEVGNISRSELIGKAVFRFTGGFGKIE